MGLRTIHALAHRTELLIIQVINGLRLRPFHGDAQDTLRLLEVLGTVGRHMAKEGMDSSQTHIAGGRLVVALGLQVLEKRRNRSGYENRNHAAACDFWS